MTSRGGAGADGFVLPRYGEGALTDVLPSVLAALGMDAEPDVLGLPRSSCYVVHLVDALGWNLLHRYRDDAPYLASLLDSGRSLTSGVPSTTSTSIVGLGTGRAPGSHGVVGYTIGVAYDDASGRVPELLNTLKWDSAFPPREWQPHRTALERAQAAGVSVTSVGPNSFQGSGLTVAGLTGGSYVPADSIGQRIDRVARACERGESALIYAYEGDLDWTGHREGCESAAYRHQLAGIDAYLRRLRAALPAHATLLITGDHGMVDIPADARVDVQSDPGLSAGVRMVAGDARLRYLYTDPGGAEKLAERWRNRLGDKACVLTREEAIEAGWFGPVEARVRPWIGDVVIAARDRIAVECRSMFPAEPRLVGWHGSLTADEMLVPLLVDQG